MPLEWLLFWVLHRLPARAHRPHSATSSCRRVRR